MSLAVTDAVSRVLGIALDGVTARQGVIADNIANVDTPGFRAQSVDFESSLRQAVQSGTLGATDNGVHVQTSQSAAPLGANGNNVDLKSETLAAVQSQYQYQVIARAVSDRLTRIHDSIGGGS